MTIFHFSIGRSHTCKSGLTVVLNKNRKFHIHVYTKIQKFDSDHYIQIFIWFWSLHSNFHLILITAFKFSFDSDHCIQISIWFWSLHSNFHLILITTFKFSFDSDHYIQIFIWRTVLISQTSLISDHHLYSSSLLSNNLYYMWS